MKRFVSYYEMKRLLLVSGTFLSYKRSVLCKNFDQKASPFLRALILYGSIEAQWKPVIVSQLRQ